MFSQPGPHFESVCEHRTPTIREIASLISTGSPSQVSYGLSELQLYLRESERNRGIAIEAIPLIQAIVGKHAQSCLADSPVVAALGCLRLLGDAGAQATFETLSRILANRNSISHRPVSHQLTWELARIIIENHWSTIDVLTSLIGAEDVTKRHMLKIILGAIDREDTGLHWLVRSTLQEALTNFDGEMIVSAARALMNVGPITDTGSSLKELLHLAPYLCHHDLFLSDILLILMISGAEASVALPELRMLASSGRGAPPPSDEITQAKEAMIERALRRGNSQIAQLIHNGTLEPLRGSHGAFQRLLATITIGHLGVEASEALKEMMVEALSPVPGLTREAARWTCHQVKAMGIIPKPNWKSAIEHTDEATTYAFDRLRNYASVAKLPVPLKEAIFGSLSDLSGNEECDYQRLVQVVSDVLEQENLPLSPKSREVWGTRRGFHRVTRVNGIALDDLPPEQLAQVYAEIILTGSDNASSQATHLLRCSPFRHAAVQKVLEVIRQTPAGISSFPVDRAANVLFALHKVGSIGIPLIPAAMKIITEADDIRSLHAIAYYMAYIGPRAIPAIRECSRNNRSSIREMAVRSLRVFPAHNAESLAIIERGLFDHSPSVRQSAVYALRDLTVLPESIRSRLETLSEPQPLLARISSFLGHIRRKSFRNLAFEDLAPLFNSEEGFRHYVRKTLERFP